MNKTELTKNAQTLYTKFLKENNGNEPVCASCLIEYKDDKSTLEVNIALYDQTPEGWDDDDIFFYTSGIQDLCSLADDDENGEDFVIAEIFELL